MMAYGKDIETPRESKILHKTKRESHISDNDPIDDCKLM